MLIMCSQIYIFLKNYKRKIFLSKSVNITALPTLTYWCISHPAYIKRPWDNNEQFWNQLMENFIQNVFSSHLVICNGSAVISVYRYISCVGVEMAPGLFLPLTYTHLSNWCKGVGPKVYCKVNIVSSAGSKWIKHT